MPSKPPLRIVERDAPLRILLDLSRRAAAGVGSVVLLEGEAGIGKTTLLTEFARAAGADCRVLLGRCDALFTPRPLGPLQDMAQYLSPRVAELLDGTAPPARLFPVVLGDLQSAHPATVMIFEDVHWADRGTLDLVKYIGRRIGMLPALVILSFRKDEVDDRHPLSQVLGDLPSTAVARITLAPLSPDAVATLARAAGRSSAGLHAITAGNPFFVTELLASTVGEQAELPASITDTVWARFSRLAPREREVLETISVVPGRVERWLLYALLGPELEGIVESCVAHGLVTQDGDGALMFRHELARQATLARVPKSVQKRLHAKYEAAISAKPLAEEDIDLSRHVFHAAGAEDAARVLEIAPRAAKQAARLGAHQQAAAHLATALRFVAAAPPALAAQLNEDWAYEAGLALRIDDAVIEARLRAVDLWRAQGRSEKVGHNLRWLSRLHWYRGEADQAGRYADDAVQALEALPPGPELAMAYSVRSQLHMLNDRMDEAIDWGTRAIALAEQLGEADTRAHALNNVGTAMLFSGRSGGREMLEESLSIALTHGFHEHAARAYTNLSEYAVVFKDFALAERIMSDGISFDTRHDLDSWTHYLVGWQAQLRLEQGHLRDAETIARGVLSLERLTLVMRLPALTVLAKVRVRLGEKDGPSLLQEALQQALATGEPQRIVPVRIALVEAAWLADDRAACHEQLSELDKMDLKNFDAWGLGELATWRHRVGHEEPPSTTDIPPPRAAELRGDVVAAADEWERLGLPYEAALALIQVRGAGAETAFARAVSLLDAIEARPAAARAREAARLAGATAELPALRRGEYAVARRHHPLGLTKRECEVLSLVAEGVGNNEIAARLFRSPRTVENHVSAVLAKLKAANRMEAALRVRSEPWLISAGLAPAPAKN